MPYDGKSAASFADSHAEAASTQNCARYVRRAIEWGGISLPHTHDAKDYGRILEATGFYEVHGAPQRGDIAVIQGFSGHPQGHMAIFDGTIWVSDFKQRAGPQGFYPGPEYRSAQPPYKIYRHD
jgi:hypothetical protein